MKVNYDRFGSIKEMTKMINSRKVNTTVFGSEYNCDSITGSKAFTGTYSYEEAEHLLTYGWDCEYLNAIKKGVENLKVTGYNNRRRTKVDVVGYTPCVPRAIQGLPDSMFNTHTIREKVKTITIVYDGSVSCNIKESDMTKAGIALLGVVNTLEARGIKVELDLCYGTFVNSISRKKRKYQDEITLTRLTVKKFRDSLDLKKIVFPIANPSMFRRIYFRYLETMPTVENIDFRTGYGYPMHGLDSSRMKEIKKIILKENEYFIDYYDVFGKEPSEIIKNKIAI